MEPDLERVLMNLPDIILVFDDSGRIEFANTALGQLLKRRTRDFFGMSLEEIQAEYPGPWHVLKQAVERRRLEGPGAPAGETRRGQAKGYAARDPLAPGGTNADPDDHQPALSFGRRLFTYKTFTAHPKDQVSLRIGVTLMEITEERKLLDRLTMAEQVTGLSTLAAGIAHELNNPLFSVIGRAEAILSEEDSAKVRAHAEKVLDSARRMAAMIQNFSGYAGRREKEGKTSAVDINERLITALDIVLAPFDTRGLELQKNLGELKPVRAYPEEILMVFIPVIKNAVQALEAEGRLSLTTRQDAGGITVTIEDNGPGIPEAYRHRIFDPFFTTKGQGQGTGLGLNTAYRIMENFGGGIELDTEEGRGTVFTLRFPANP